MPTDDHEERHEPDKGAAGAHGAVSMPIEDADGAGTDETPPPAVAAVRDAQVADAHVEDAGVRDASVAEGAPDGETAVSDDSPPTRTASDDPSATQAASGGDTAVAATVDAVMQSADAETAVSEQLVAIVEALVFASPEPITSKALLKLLDTEQKDDVRAALAELTRRYESRGGGLQLLEVAGGHQIVTRPELHDWVRRMFHERTTQKLSVQALETLAVIAYKQPITAAEITDIRGVNTSGVIGTLLERGLVKIAGRKQVVGRPFLYATTRDFLDRFGLRDLNDLPKVEDMAEALGFEVPAGIATDAPASLLPSEEPATEEDAAVLAGLEEADADSETEN
jgi:segregation and condensation protein B